MDPSNRSGLRGESPLLRFFFTCFCCCFFGFLLLLLFLGCGGGGLERRRMRTNCTSAKCPSKPYTGKAFNKAIERETWERVDKAVLKREGRRTSQATTESAKDEEDVEDDDAVGEDEDGEDGDEDEGDDDEEAC
jgi:hypothetical protein